MRGLVSSAVAIALASAAVPARADDATTCIAAFEEGQKLAAAGKLLSARDQLDACAKPSCPAAVRTDCLERRDRLDRAIPTVAIAVRDANGRDVDATLSLDGKPFDAPKGRAVPIDPGPHTFRVVVGGKAHDEQVTIVEGEKSRIVTLTWKDAAEATPPPSAPTPPSGPAHEDTSHGPGVMPYVLIVGGGLLVGTGVVFGVMGTRANNEANDIDANRHANGIDCTSPTTDPSTVTSGSTCGSLNAAYDDKRSAATTNRRNAAIFGVLGLGALAGGIVWLVVAPRRSTSSARVVPLIDASTAGAALSGTF